MESISMHNITHNATNYGVSLVGRYKIIDQYHGAIFATHGITATLCLVYFAILYNLNKTKENQWYHKWLGRTMIIPLFLTLLTGFGLLYYVKDGAVHDVRLARTTINSQGLTGAIASLNAFVFQRYIKGVWLSKVLLVCLGLTFLLGVKSLLFCFLTSFDLHAGDYSPALRYRITAFEFLIVIAIPVVLVEGAFFCMHWTMSKHPAMLKTMFWKDFHEMCVMSVMYFIGIGAVFSLSHDKYWIWGHIRPTGLTLYERLPILLAPLVYIVIFKLHRFTVPINRILTWPSKQLNSATKND